MIDIRTRGPHGMLAGELVGGRPLLDHLLDVAERATGHDGAAIPIHACEDEHVAIQNHLARRQPGRFTLAIGPTPAGAFVLRADRLYDPAKLRGLLKRGKDPEPAAIWRLDSPGGLQGAGDELARRVSYQPLGRYWALEPARWLARRLAPTRVGPNMVTLAAAGLMLAASALAGLAGPNLAANLATALLLALALVLDTADGHLARLQGTTSEFGRWLDAWLDELSDMALHAAIAWSAFIASRNPAWLMIGMAYAMGKYLYLVGVSETRGTASGGQELATAKESWPRWLARMAGHADLRWHLWMGLAAVGRLDVALAAYAGYFPARAVIGAATKARRARHA